MTPEICLPVTPPLESDSQSLNRSRLDFVSTTIDNLSADLRGISLEIHENPELNFKEFIAHDILTSYLEAQPGWKVQRSLYGIETAFLAVYDSGKAGPCVSINAEYDALPDIGHACGHNLIAIASLGAALATAAAIKENKFGGKVFLVGTPAEEGGGGKIKLIESGLYRDYPIDISLMAHPGIMPDIALCRSTAVSLFKVEYFGKEAHAAMCPHQGVMNALDALVSGYNNISFVRQQCQPGDVISGYITNGGSAVNIIPAYTSAAMATRAPTKARLAELNKKVHACFQAGAMASGTTVKITAEADYDDHVPNKVLGNSYRHWFNALGGYIPEEKEDLENGLLPGGTDQGNVSYVVPSLHAMFKIDSPCGQHQIGFAAAAKAMGAHENALRAGKAMCLTAIDILADKTISEELKKAFRDDIADVIV